MLKSYKNLEYSESMKIHFLASRLILFTESMGAISIEHGYSFHQAISAMKIRYQVMYRLEVTQYARRSPLSLRSSNFPIAMPFMHFFSLLYACVFKHFIVK